MPSLIQPQTLSIAEASLLFYSHYYKNLKCKVVQKVTNIVLCSKMINNCVQTIVNINRELQDFVIQLYQDISLVAVFNFTYDDLDRMFSHENCNDDIKSRKFIKFVKQNDCCSLYFTIESRDIMHTEQLDINQSYAYEDYIRNIAQKFYKKMENKAIQRIKKFQSSKLQCKRLSLQQKLKGDGQNRQINNFIRLRQMFIKLQKSQQVTQKASQVVETKPTQTQSIKFRSQKKNYCKFSLTWTGPPLAGGNNSEKTLQQKKDEYKLKKIKQRSKKQINKAAQLNLTDLVIIPKIKSDKNNMRMISDGIFFPRRIKTECNQFEEFGVKFTGFLQSSPNKCLLNFKPNFHKKIFQNCYYPSNQKKQRKKGKIIKRISRLNTVEQKINIEETKCINKQNIQTKKAEKKQKINSTYQRCKTICKYNLQKYDINHKQQLSFRCIR